MSRPLLVCAMLVWALCGSSAWAQGPSEDALTIVNPSRQPVGQQHWFALNLSLLQPTTARLQVTLFRHDNLSYAAEVYAGSVLFEGMYGLGGRAIWTAFDDGDDDALLVSPGVGLHYLPERRDGDYWFGTGFGPSYHIMQAKTARTYGLFDVDISWLHEFAPHFAWEMGMKLGLAVRTSGTWGDFYKYDNGHRVSFGPSAYPLVNVFWGFRF